MSAASLTPLLVRARDAGLTVRADAGDLEVSPAAKLTPEIRAELLRHKPELVELLTWSESAAEDLLKNGLAYATEFAVDQDLGAHQDHQDAVNEAYYAQDMFALRVAVREWARACVAAFRAQQRDRGTAA